MVNLHPCFTSCPSSLHRRGIFHDEAVYPESHKFNPDRFLNKDGKIDPSVPDPEHRVYGSGRRFALGSLIGSSHFLTEIWQDLPGSVLCDKGCVYHHHEGSGDVRYSTSGRRKRGDSDATRGVHNGSYQVCRTARHFLR